MELWPGRVVHVKQTAFHETRKWYFYNIIAEREVRQLIVQCGGRIWASATIKLYLSVTHCGPARKLCFGPPRACGYNPHHVISRLSLAEIKMDEYESISDRRRRLTRERLRDIEG